MSGHFSEMEEKGSERKRLELVALVGIEVGMKWGDGVEHYIPMERLRAWSPSAETQGEVDILGYRHGGSDQKEYPGVTVKSYEPVGSYGLRFNFSDGHNTGIYSFDYLRKLGEWADGQGSGK